MIATNTNNTSPLGSRVKVKNVIYYFSNGIMEITWPKEEEQQLMCTKLSDTDHRVSLIHRKF